MRKDEGDEVEAAFKDRQLNFIRVDAADRFLGKLAGVTDPEMKRKIIGEEFVRVFEEESRKLRGIAFLAQGTIYPDIAESGKDGKGLVKSHHNVGGLPEDVEFKGIIEPLRDMYKDEVRELGLELGLPASLINRQPFPGPGLCIRVIGEVTKPRLDILRKADAIFRKEIELLSLTGVNQYFAVLTDVRSVGVSDGGTAAAARTYDYTVALRAVSTGNFMSADWVRLPYDLLERVSARITGECAGVNRVVYDVTAKPPGTIEWE
jgi:GMP synthase (glutamine-hydrolysing)